MAAPAPALHDPAAAASASAILRRHQSPLQRVRRPVEYPPPHGMGSAAADVLVPGARPSAAAAPAVLPGSYLSAAAPAQRLALVGRRQGAGHGTVDPLGLVLPPPLRLPLPSRPAVLVQPSFAATPLTRFPLRPQQQQQPPPPPPPAQPLVLKPLRAPSPLPRRHRRRHGHRRRGDDDDIDGGEEEDEEEAFVFTTAPRPPTTSASTTKDDAYVTIRPGVPLKRAVSTSLADLQRRHGGRRVPLPTSPFSIRASYKQPERDRVFLVQPGAEKGGQGRQGQRHSQRTTDTLAPQPPAHQQQRTFTLNSGGLARRSRHARLRSYLYGGVSRNREGLFENQKGTRRRRRPGTVPDDELIIAGRRRRQIQHEHERKPPVAGPSSDLTDTTTTADRQYVDATLQTATGDLAALAQARAREQRQKERQLQQQQQQQQVEAAPPHTTTTTTTGAEKHHLRPTANDDDLERQQEKRLRAIETQRYRHAKALAQQRQQTLQVNVVRSHLEALARQDERRRQAEVQRRQLRRDRAQRERMAQVAIEARAEGERLDRLRALCRAREEETLWQLERRERRERARREQEALEWSRREAQLVYEAVGRQRRRRSQPQPEGQGGEARGGGDKKKSAGARGQEENASAAAATTITTAADDDIGEGEQRARVEQAWLARDANEAEFASEGALEAALLALGLDASVVARLRKGIIDGGGAVAGGSSGAEDTGGGDGGKDAPLPLPPPSQPLPQAEAMGDGAVTTTTATTSVLATVITVDDDDENGQRADEPQELDAAERERLDAEWEELEHELEEEALADEETQRQEAIAEQERMLAQARRRASRRFTTDKRALMESLARFGVSEGEAREVVASTSTGSKAAAANGGASGGGDDASSSLVLGGGGGGSGVAVAPRARRLSVSIATRGSGRRHSLLSMVSPLPSLKSAGSRRRRGSVAIPTRSSLPPALAEDNETLDLGDDDDNVAAAAAPDADVELDLE